MELVTDFENLMLTFLEDIKPYAVEICKYLQRQYLKSVGIGKEADSDEEDSESLISAIESFTSMTKIIEVANDDVQLLGQLEKIVQPCLVKILAPDCHYSLEEALDCIILMLHHGYKDERRHISPGMWKLFPQLLRVCFSNGGYRSGEFCFQYINYVAVAIKNYIAYDPDGLMEVSKKEKKMNMELLIEFIVKCLEVNRGRPGNDYMSGISIVSMIIALIENLIGRIDNIMPQLLAVLVGELNSQEAQGAASKPL